MSEDYPWHIVIAANHTICRGFKTSSKLKVPKLCVCTDLNYKVTSKFLNHKLNLEFTACHMKLASKKEASHILDQFLSCFGCRNTGLWSDFTLWIQNNKNEMWQWWRGAPWQMQHLSQEQLPLKRVKDA